MRFQRSHKNNCRPGALTGRWVRRVRAPGLQTIACVFAFTLASTLHAIPVAEPDSACFIRVPRPPRPGSTGGTVVADGDTARKSDEKGLQNLALRPAAKAFASSALSGYDIHKIEHLNDGKLGNCHSWICGGGSGSAGIDLGDTFHICRVAIGSDSTGKYNDRAPTVFSIQTAEESGEDAHWKDVFAYSDKALNSRNTFTFTPVKARQVRIVIESSNSGNPRLEEIEVFGSKEPISKDKVGKLSPQASSGDEIRDFNKQLQMAILGVEHAWLKTAGHADIEYRLRRTPYPEKRFPAHAAADTLPLPSLSAAPKLETAAKDPIWQEASRGVVRVCSIDKWAESPLVEYTVEAATHSSDLYICISADRILSSHMALIGVNNQPNKGLIRVGPNGIEWMPLDAGGKAAGKATALPGEYDPEKNLLVTKVPLNWIAEYEKHGLYIGTGIGGRWTHAGGHPINFFPAPLSLRQSGAFNGRTFPLTASLNTPNYSITMKSATGFGRIDLSSFGLTRLTRTFMLPAQCRGVGAESVVDITDSRGGKWRMTLFRYAPAQKALELYADLIRRRENSGSELKHERQLLTDFKSRHKASLKNGKYNKQAERSLLAEICAAKRSLFLRDERLAPLSKMVFSKRHPFHPSHNYSVQFDSPWRPGGGIWSINIPFEKGSLNPEKAELKQLFDSGNGIARNPSLSFDAKKLYYAHRSEKKDYYRIYEQDLKTGKRRRVSAEGPFHDYWPTPLPDGGMAFISTRCKKKFLCWRPQAAVLFRMDMDGTNIDPLSYANLTEFAPSVLDDGRILWTRSEYADKGADYGHTLWTMRADGTYPELTFGNTVALPQGFANGRMVPGTREVCAVMISHFGDLNGPVALMDMKKGPHDPTGIQCITPEIPWPGYSPKSETFREPVPITEDLILIAHAPQDRFGIYLIDRYGNRELLYMDDSIDSVCPQPLIARSLPPVMKGGIVPELAAKKMGQFSVENVYRGLEGQVEPGSAKYLRICRELPTWLRQMPDGTYQADHSPFMQWYASPVDRIRGPHGWPSYIAKGVVGTVPVESDGSANFLAPAEQVLYFELLDENYNEIQRMRSVVQLRPGERRSCIGCHESRLITPDQQYLKMMAMQKDPVEPQAPPWGAGPFWFESVVQPVLDAKCISCHNEKTPNKIDLTESRDKENIPRSYRNLIKSGTIHHFDYGYQRGVPYKADPYTFGTQISSLWKILEDKNHKDVKLTQNQKRAIKCWTDLNVPLWGDYAFRPERKDFRPQDEKRWQVD